MTRTSPSYRARSQGHDLNRVLPQQRTGACVVQFPNVDAKITEQPRHISRAADMGSGVVAKPADTTAFGLATEAVIHPIRWDKVIVEPVKFAAQLDHAPVIPQDVVMPKIKRGSEDAGAALGIRAILRGFKTDIHEGIPGKARPFVLFIRKTQIAPLRMIAGAKGRVYTGLKKNMDPILFAVKRLLGGQRLSVKNRMAGCSYHREIAFLNAMPMTVTGKVIHKELKARAAAEVTP